MKKDHQSYSLGWIHMLTSAIARVGPHENKNLNVSKPRTAVSIPLVCGLALCQLSRVFRKWVFVAPAGLRQKSSALVRKTNFKFRFYSVDSLKTWWIFLSTISSWVWVNWNFRHKPVFLRWHRCIWIVSGLRENFFASRGTTHFWIHRRFINPLLKLDWEIKRLSLIDAEPVMWQGALISLHGGKRTKLCMILKSFQCTSTADGNVFLSALA